MSTTRDSKFGGWLATVRWPGRERASERRGGTDDDDEERADRSEDEIAAE